jgi:hypothetical protein
MTDKPGTPAVRTMRAQGLVNLVVRGLLRTPGLSRIIGSRLVTLYVVGRKSGRRYTVPVSYLAQGDDLLVGTSFGWPETFGQASLWPSGSRERSGWQTSRLRPLSPTSSRHTHTWRPRIRHSPALEVARIGVICGFRRVLRRVQPQVP